MSLPYDKSNPKSILEYAQKLMNKTLRDFVDGLTISEFESNRKRKGEYGNMIEKYYFGYDINSDSKPDFEEAGLELKTTPLKVLKKGNKVPKERLVMNMIKFTDIVNENWETSSFLRKNARLLLIIYLYEKEKLPRDYIIELVNIWDFPKKDLLIIEKDWQFIQNKIKNGKAHELSEGDTLYLGACTKAADGTKRTKQPYSSIEAKPRAFSLKAGYIKTIIESFIKKNKEDTILKDLSILYKETLEQYVKSKFENYIGLSPEEIASKLGTSINPNSKGYTAKLARQILGVKGNRIEEFEKANITMKTIRLNKKGTPRESISFPAFKYKEIVDNDWYDSEILEMMDKKFFFVIFQYNESGRLYLKKVMFWNIPYNDLEVDVRGVYEDTKKKILSGDYENFVKISEKRVASVRPHAKNKKDTFEGIDGKKYTKKCFRLNAKYIAEQIN